MNLLPKLEDWKWFGISLSLFDPIYPINTQVHQFFLPFITFSPPHPLRVSPTESHCSHCFTLMAATISKWPPSLSLTISQFALHTASRTIFPKMQIWSWHPTSSNSSMTPHSHQDKAHLWIRYGGLSCSHLSAVTSGALCITCPVLAVPHVYYAHMHPPPSPLIHQHALPSSRKGFPSTPYLHGLANYFLSFKTQHNYHLLGVCFTAGFGSLLSVPQHPCGSIPIAIITWHHSHLFTCVSPTRLKTQWGQWLCSCNEHLVWSQAWNTFILNKSRQYAEGRSLSLPNKWENTQFVLFGWKRSCGINKKMGVSRNQWLFSQS